MRRELEDPNGDAMKTSNFEVHDMLSVLSVLGVEKRIGEVPGVESVTVNFAAGSATVRYDETRLEIADIRSAVRQSGFESAAPAAASAGDVHKGHTAQAAPPAPPASSAPSTPPPPPAGATRQDNAAPSTPSKTSAAAPAGAPASAAPKSAPGVPAGETS